MCYKQGWHTRFIHADTDAIASHARLCHFKHRITDAISITDANLVIKKPFDGEVLPELAESKIVAAKELFPVMVGIHLIDKYRARSEERRVGKECKGRGAR